MNTLEPPLKGTQEPSAARQRAFLLSSLAIIPLFVILSLAFLELVLSVAGFGFESKPLRDQGNLYWTENPDYVQLFHRGNGGDRSSQVEVLTHHLVLKEKQPGTLRGFALGGSTLQGFPFSVGLSFPALSGKLLKAAGAPVEIINLGYSAMSTDYVRITAQKILEYKPDFLVIYAGHNDFYGTTNAFNSGDMWQRDLRIFLRQFRIFQLLYGIVEGGSAPSGDNTRSLMAQQFSQGRYPHTSEINNTVENFLKSNLSSLFELYASRNIPVFIFTPISNLKDMPPFGGLLDQEIKIKSVDPGTISLIAEDYEYFLQKKAPQLVFNEGLRQTDRARRDELLKEARDLDAIPFRARSFIPQAIRDLALKYPRNQVVFIDSEEQLEKWTGSSVRGNELFIDHLHFRPAGNWLFARILAYQLADYFKFSPDVSKFLDVAERKNFEDFNELTGYNDYWEMDAFQTIAGLTLQPPYSEMLVPYRMNLKELEDNEIWVNEDLKSLLTQAPATKRFFVYSDYLKNKGRKDDYLSLLDSAVNLASGSSLMHRIKLKESGEENPDYARWIKEVFGNQ